MYVKTIAGYYQGELPESNNLLSTVVYRQPLTYFYMRSTLAFNGSILRYGFFLHNPKVLENFIERYALLFLHDQLTLCP